MKLKLTNAQVLSLIDALTIAYNDAMLAASRCHTETPELARELVGEANRYADLLDAIDRQTKD